MTTEQDKEFDTTIKKIDNNTIKLTRVREQTITREELEFQRDHYEKELYIIQNLLDNTNIKISILDAV